MFAIIEPINDEYEYIQYNEQLCLIHSIKDDMYQMQSIINSCHSNKRANKWFENESTQELLNEMREAEKCSSQNLYENRTNISMGLRGYYVHRLLVNHVAIWASPKYSYYIMKLLDSYFENQRIELQNQIIKQQNQIQSLIPRCVPSNHKNDYVFFIWKEIISKSNSHVILHLVRCHKESFSKVKSHFYNMEERWFYRDGLPISMCCLRDIKNLIAELKFDFRDVYIEGCNIFVKIDQLDTLQQLIETYFNEFHD